MQVFLVYVLAIAMWGLEVVTAGCSVDNLSFPGLIRRKSMFYEGETFLPSCEKGYRVANPEASRLWCRQGIWIGHMPPCIRAGCSVDNLSFPGLILRKSMFYEGETFLPSCEKGYRVSKPEASRLWCRQGILIGHMPPCTRDNADRCKEPPPSIANGHIAHFTGEHASIVRYECKEFYFLQQSQNTGVECLFGEWKGRVPECKDSRCYFKDLGIKMGISARSGKVTKHNEYLDVVCDHGYTPTGDRPFCFEGRWNEPVLSPCQENRCKEPPPSIANGHIAHFTGEHASIVRYECKEFYFLQQSQNTGVECLFGEWKGRVPECKDSRCYFKDLGIKMGISARSGKVTKHNKYLDVVCDHGYTPTGERPFCFEGRWNEPVLSPCQERSCEIFTIRNGALTVRRPGPRYLTWNGYVQDDIYEEIPVGTEISSGNTSHLHCFNGYSVEGSGSSVLPITCRKGKWYPDPVCLPNGTAYVEEGVTAASTSKPSTPRTVAVAELSSTESNLKFSKTTRQPTTSSSTDESCEISTIRNGALTVRRLGPRYLTWEGYVQDDIYEEIPIGTVISSGNMRHLHCFEGYSVQGSDSSVLPITCQKGKWYPDPVCLPRKQLNSDSCYLKDLRMKMGVSKETTEVTNHDEYLDVVCDRGYTPTGERPFCFEGRWNESVLSPCRERGCEIPAIRNGALTERRLGTQYWTRNGRVRDYVFEEIPVGTEISSGNTSHLYCFDGYSVHGSGSSVLPITCQKGKWYPDPVCLPHGVAYVEGVVTAASTSKPSIPRTVAVAEVPSTESNIKFLKATTQPTTSSSTDEDLCEAPIAPENGKTVIKPSVPRIGSFVSYVCNEGFILEGSPSARCLETGKWTSPAPKCLHTCKIPDYISHGKIGVYKTSDHFTQTTKFETISTGTRIKDGEFVLRCDDKYKVIGTEAAEGIVECTGGAWSDNLKCLPDGVAYEEEVVTNASTSKPSVPRTAAVTEVPSTESNPKFSKKTTLPPTSSSTDGPPCSLESLYQRLPEDVVIGGDQPLNDIVPYGTSLSLTCQYGLRLRGRGKAKCEEDRKWKIPSVRCVLGCGPIPKAANSRLIIEPEKEFYVFGESAIFSCPPGYTLTSELQLVVCLSNTWSEEEFPDCERV